MKDIRYAVRSLRRQPVFAIVAILTLTLGIGANTAIFSLVYQTLLKPLPYGDPDRLVFVWNTYPLMGSQASVSIPDYLDRRTQAAAIEDAALFTTRSINLVAGSQPEQLRALAVTPSFFTTLGRQPMLGRGFVDGEATPDADRFVILTYGIWTSQFGADPALVGRDVRLNGESYRVVGVLPRDFDLPSRDIAALVPFSFTPQQMSRSGPRQRVQLDDRAPPAGRDDRSARRADEGHHQTQPRAAAAGRRSGPPAVSAASPSRCASSWSATCGRRSTCCRLACWSCC